MKDGLNGATQIETTLTNLDLISFFIPLAASAMIMMASHSIVSSALARTTAAEVSIAAFAVAQSILVMFEKPCYYIRRMAVALFDDQLSYKSVRIVALSVPAISVSLMAIVAFTPVGKLVFIDTVGIKPALFPEVIKAFRLFLILPAFSAIRSFYQGLIIVRKKTYLMTVSILIRLSVMFIVSPLVLRAEFLTGSAVGAIVLITGIFTESLLALLFARHYKNHLPAAPKEGLPITVKGVWVFFIPLIAAVFVETFNRPSINAGLARVVNPERALAAFHIAYSFSWIFVAMAFGIHQLVVVFVRDHKTYLKTKRFILIIGCMTTCLLLTIALTPLGTWSLTRVIGVEENLAEPALKTIAILAFIPLIMSISEMYVGILILNKRTPSITLSKVANLFTLIMVVFSISRFLPHLGGRLAGISMLAGYLVECAIVFWRSRKYIPNDITTP